VSDYIEVISILVDPTRPPEEHADARLINDCLDEMYDRMDEGEVLATLVRLLRNELAAPPPLTLVGGEAEH
jgi:hypothetical protein